ncbi:MAG TPA: hypothetical protein VGG34_07595 [Opitutaceae bacterium]|jgi:hypothetical protein
MNSKTLAPAAAVLAAILLGSCSMQPDIALKVTTADGVNIEVPLREQLPPVSDGDITVEALTFAPFDIDKDTHKAKTLAYSFIDGFRPPAAPAKIVIDDVSNDPILLIHEDDHPIIQRRANVKDALWAAFSKPWPPNDEHVNWILDIDNKVRVYRETITLKDGSVHIMYKPIFVPAAMKIFMQKDLDTTAAPPVPTPEPSP